MEKPTKSKKAKISKGKKKVKTNNEDKYLNLLKKIDINLEEKEGKTANISESNEENLLISKEERILSVTDLLANLQEKNIKTSKIKQQITDLNARGQKIQEAVSTRLQDKAERKANYKIAIKDVNKWQSIIKRNREAEHLDFSQKTKVDSKRINAMDFKAASNNEFTSKLESKIKELNMENECDFKKQNEKETPKAMNELMKHKNLLFYQELKQKRLSKIKSKLYHKLKSKKLRQQQLKNNILDPSFQANEIEKMTVQRAEERLSLRHKMKSKYVQNLIRYGGNKKDIKNSINDANQIRTELLKKIHGDPNIDNDYSEDEENNEEFKEKMIEELEKEFLKEGEEEQKKETTGLKFLDNALERKKSMIKNEAVKLLGQLKGSKDLDNIAFSSDEKPNDRNNIESEAEEEFNNNQNNNNKKDETLNENKDEEVFEGRMKFVKTNEKNTKKIGIVDYAKKDLSALKVLNKFVNENDQTKNNEIETSKPNNLSENIIEGVNVDKLKKKYNKKIDLENKLNNLEMFDEENLESVYQNIEFNQVSDKMNEEEFNNEKLNEMDLIEEKKNLKSKGWGSWAGAGIEEKKISNEDKIQKRKLEIEQIKKNRKDGNLDSVIINEKRNKNISKYLVSELPVPFKSKEQFNFLNNMALGSEWNTLTTHRNMIKPELINKKGEIIDPIKYSKTNLSIKSRKF